MCEISLLSDLHVSGHWFDNQRGIWIVEWNERNEKHGWKRILKSFVNLKGSSPIISLSQGYLKLTWMYIKGYNLFSECIQKLGENLICYSGFHDFIDSNFFEEIHCELSFFNKRLKERARSFATICLKLFVSHVFHGSRIAY